MERKTVIQYLVDTEKSIGGCPPEDLNKFITWLQEKRDLIPEEYRHTALFEIGAYVDYGGSYYSYSTLTYKAPETDEQMKARCAKESGEATRRQECGRQQYEALRKKFEA